MSNRLISVLCLPLGEKAIYAYALLGAVGSGLLLTHSYHETGWLTIAGACLVVPMLIWIMVAVLVVAPVMLKTWFAKKRPRKQPHTLPRNQA